MLCSAQLCSAVLCYTTRQPPTINRQDRGTDRQTALRVSSRPYVQVREVRVRVRSSVVYVRVAGTSYAYSNSTRGMRFDGRDMARARGRNRDQVQWESLGVSSHEAAVRPGEERGKKVGKAWKIPKIK